MPKIAHCQTGSHPGDGRMGWIAGLLAIALPVLLSGSLVHADDPLDAERLFDQGQYREASQMAAEAIAGGDYREQWRLLKIQADMAVGQYATALDTLDQALESFPNSIQLRWLGADVCRFNGDAPRADQMLDEIRQLHQRSSWRYTDAANQITLGRFFLQQGADARDVLEIFYDPVLKKMPDALEAHLAVGQLALDKTDYALAAQTFEKAMHRFLRRSELHFGLAQAFSPSDPTRAATELQKALELNPQHEPSLLMIAERLMDAEQYDQAIETLDRVADVNPESPAMWAYLAVIANFQGDRSREALYRKVALSGWSTNPFVDHVIGRKLSQHYRFAEGAEYQRRALQMDSDYLPARFQLSQDLLRLGQEEEGWELVDQVFQQDPYHVVAHNLTQLRDKLQRYTTIENEHFVLRMEAGEAAIYGQRVLELLEQARLTLAAKYQVEMPERVTVEIFPQQADFAIRTFGLPGGEGFLGVCFGPVITANSPAAQPRHASNWQAVLWHELCHVVTLTKTNNRMPRWLSEGISVYEERLADPAWGQSMNAQYRQMILGDQLTPVSQLSSAFMRPPTPMHLQFAYYEASLVVEYLLDNYGLEMMLRVLDDLGVGMPINESLARYTGSLELLDAEFAEFARQRAQQLGNQVDWTEPEFPPTATADDLEEWTAQHPNQFFAWKQLALHHLRAEQWDQAATALQRAIELYPDDPGPEGARQLLAGVYRETGQVDQECRLLESVVLAESDAKEAAVRLLELQERAQDWAAVRETAERVLAINPLVADPYRSLGRAAEALEDVPLAIEAYQTLAQLDLVDPAGTNFRLARLYFEAGDIERARRRTLMALEEAPRYREAHALLLRIVESPSTPPDTEPPPPR